MSGRIVVRDIHLKDFSEIQRINRQSAHQYDLENCEFVLGGVAVDEEDKVIGFAGVKIIHEAVLITDQSRSKSERITAMRQLMLEGLQRSIQKGIKFWHAFCDVRFAILLTRWFDFKPAEGQALVLTVDGRYNVQERREENEGAIAAGPDFRRAEVRSNHPTTSPRKSTVKRAVSAKV